MIDRREILPADAYARVRSDALQALGRHKAQRRIELGRYLCMLFESRATVLGQIHEIVRIEGRTSPIHIQREIDEYACLIPSPTLLTATLTVQAGPEAIGVALSDELAANSGPITLEVGGWQTSCQSLGPVDAAPTGVHYIGFPITEPLSNALRSHARAWLRLRSSIDNHDLELPEPLRAALVDTLEHHPKPQLDLETQCQPW